MILDRVLALAGHDDDGGEARGHRLLDHVLDDGLVHERQHLLGLRLRGGEEAGAEAGGRKHRLADLLVGHHARKCYHATPGQRFAHRAILRGHAGPQVRRREPRGRPRHAREPRSRAWTSVQAFPGLAGVDPWALDAERRALIQEVEELRHRQRLAGEEIARRGKAKEDASDLKAEMKGVADRIKAGDARLEEVKAAIERFLLVVPNLPDASVPVGKDASANVEVRRVGAPPRLRLRAEVALGPRPRARHPRLRARRPGSRGRASPSTGTWAPASSGRSSSSCWTCTARGATARSSRPTSSPRRRSPAPASSPSSRTTSSRRAPATATST